MCGKRRSLLQTSSAREGQPIGVRLRLLDLFALLAAITVAESSPCACHEKADALAFSSDVGESEDTSAYPDDETLVSGQWEYRFMVSLRGSMSEGAFGVLMFDGVEVPIPQAVNDYYLTPWGNVYWVGEGFELWGEHGWMLHPDTYRPEGHQIPDPGTAISGALRGADQCELGDGDDALAAGTVPATPACHPADSSGDWVIDSQELEAYEAAWEEGLEWRPGQGTIDSSYVARAIYIWSNGGEYCETGAEAPYCWEVYSPSPVMLDESGNGLIICMHQGSELEISLAGNATTGYMWELASCNEAVLAETGECYRCDDPDADGAGGTSAFQFTAITAGRTQVRIDYRRSWGSDAPIDSYEVGVIVR